MEYNRNMIKLNNSQIVEMLNETDGKIFTVSFIKRTTGELRVMNCRLGVKKHLKGGVQVYDPKEYALLTVFDMQKKAYRSISLDAIVSVKLDGIEYINDSQ